MVHSFYDNAHDIRNVSFVVYCDEDDLDSIKLCEELNEEFGSFDFIIGKRIVQSEMTNVCYRSAIGKYIMMAADDLVCETPYWDVLVERAFNLYRDKIALVYFNDGHHADKFATHPILSRKSIEIMGQVCDGRFHHAYADTSLWDIFSSLQRTYYIPSIIRHNHPDFKTRPFDRTDEQQRENLNKYRPDLLYLNSAKDRQELISKLSNYIEDFNRAKSIS